MSIKYLTLINSDRIEIDITHDNYNPYGLWARKIWETLFRKVKAEQFKSLDSFLCDLNIIEKYIFDHYSEKEGFSFYWSWDKSGWTEITDYKDYTEDQFKITIKHPRIIIEAI